MATILDDLKMQFRTGDVTTKLIFWNIGLFVVPEVANALLSLSGIHIDYQQYVSLSSSPLDLLWKPWSLLTYAFFHAGLVHLLFNMLMLHFAGRLFHTFFTQKQFLGLYLTGAIFAGMIYVLCYSAFFGALHIPIVGASAAIMAVLFATVAYSPNMLVRLMFFGNVKLWHIAFFLIVIDLLQLPLSNTGGHLSHLGGAFFGYFYITQLRAGRDFATWFANLPNVFSRKKKTFKKVHRNYTPPQPNNVSKNVTKDKTQQQIDEILDKISKSGYDSLTKEEKDFLFRAGK